MKSTAIASATTLTRVGRGAQMAIVASAAAIVVTPAFRVYRKITARIRAYTVKKVNAGT